MSLFDEKPGINTNSEQNGVGLPGEATLHALFSEIASGYVKLIRKAVLPKLNIPKSYSIRDIQVLSTIASIKDAATSSQVYRATGLDPATVTRSVKALTTDGYLDVKENMDDSRSRILSLTNKGNDLSDAFNRACRELFASEDLAAPEMSMEEYRVLTVTLSKLKNRVRILTLKSF